MSFEIFALRRIPLTVRACKAFCSTAGPKDRHHVGSSHRILRRYERRYFHRPRRRRLSVPVLIDARRLPGTAKTGTSRHGCSGCQTGLTSFSNLQSPWRKRARAARIAPSRSRLAGTLNRRQASGTFLIGSAGGSSREASNHTPSRLPERRQEMTSQNGRWAGRSELESDLQSGSKIGAQAL